MEKTNKNTFDNEKYNEFSKYNMQCRIVIHENKLMIFKSAQNFPFIFSKSVLNRNFLYYQYRLIDFMVNLTVSLNQYCSNA